MRGGQQQEKYVCMHIFIIKGFNECLLGARICAWYVQLSQQCYEINVVLSSLKKTEAQETAGNFSNITSWVRVPELGYSPWRGCHSP